MCGTKILRRRHLNARFRLNWFYDESGETLAGEFPLKRVHVIERNRFGFGKKRSKSIAPERVSHERQRAAGQAMEGAVCVEQPSSSRMSAREFNRRFDPFTACTSEKDLLQSPTRPSAQFFSKLACPFCHMRLNHCRATFLQLFVKRSN